MVAAIAVKRCIVGLLLCLRLNGAFTSQFPQKAPYKSQQHVGVRSDMKFALFTTSTDASQQQQSYLLDNIQTDFLQGYLQKHHADFLVDLVKALSPVGVEMAKANAWSGGSFVIESVQLKDIGISKMTLDAQVFQRRNEKRSTRTITIDLNAVADPSTRTDAVIPPLVEDDATRRPIDTVARRVARLGWMTGHTRLSGKMMQLAIQCGGDASYKLPDNLYLNQVPHNRHVRRYFYTQASKAVKDAVVLCSQGKLSNRMLVRAEFPEMNPSMDSYRIGTLLEMVRAIAISLAEEKIRVRVCVQQSMGVGIFTGVPKQLSGVNKLLQMMDWQSNEGEENAGMVGDYVRFGAIGKDHVMNRILLANGEIVQEQDDVFIIIAPQSMIGTDCSIVPLLQEMVEAAGDRPVILVNPDLTDKISSGGQQNIRGRKERIEFADSFQTVYHFQNIYISGTSYFPILGAITKQHPSEPWIAHQRRDYANDGGEIYVPVLASETRPSGEAILDCFER
jgi:adenylate kinase